MDAHCFLGVDGCRAGWFFVAFDAGGRAEFGVAETIHDLWARYHHAAAILIDIPIGLVSGHAAGRPCDAAARRLLKPRRHSAIFSPPCRQALAASDYATACRINQQACGRKLSIQTWNIVPKIREVDAFLQRTPAAKGIVRETHPEICFWALAGGRPMAHSKKSADGRQQRLDLIERWHPRSDQLFNSAMRHYPRRQLAPDDILDALANAVTAVRLKSDGATLPAEPDVDRCGLPMEMVYARFD
jgi:predicted RNase H-like nuclease